MWKNLFSQKRKGKKEENGTQEHVVIFEKFNIATWMPQTNDEAMIEFCYICRWHQKEIQNVIHYLHKNNK